MSHYKYIKLSILVVVALAVAASVPLHVLGHEEEPPAPILKKMHVVQAGEKIGESPVVTLSDVLTAADKYKGKSVVVEALVSNVCKKKGCWMELATEAGSPGVRVTFKDYGFFVPLDCEGMSVRAEGTFEMKTLSKEDADHLIGDGGTVALNADGTANEISFVAIGVELRRAKPVKKAEKSE